MNSVTLTLRACRFGPLAIFLFSILFLRVVSAETPSELTKTYFSALKKEDYKAAAAIVSPEQKKVFREMLAILDGEKAARMPSFFQIYFGAGATRESVLKMTDEEFFEVMLEFGYTKASPFKPEQFGDVEILGEIEKDKIVHVLVSRSIKVGEVQSEIRETLSFQKTEEGWECLLIEQFKAAAGALNAVITNIP